MNIVLHPDYTHFENYLKNLPQGFEKMGQELYKVRNEVRLIEVNGIKVVVKKFKQPHFINRIAYTFFRKSKAKRSFEYSEMLINKGFGAAQPIGYREDRQCGLLTSSYYISLYCDYGRDFNEFRSSELNGRESILRDFARFTANLHQAGIRHNDYGGGNIIFRPLADQTQFCLIDINRMSIGKVGLKDGCENFKLLYLKEEAFRCLIEEYALCRGFEFEECFETVKPFIR